MMFLVLLALGVLVFVLYRLRVPILAKILGQPESRIERRLQQRRDR
jgi:F0F1-type ATP synthase membrane subunit b/b'